MPLILLLIAIVTALLSGCAPRRLVAQEPGCGILFSDSAEGFGYVDRIFVDTEFEDERARLGIEQLDPAVGRSLVTDGSYCAALITQVLPMLKEGADSTSLAHSSYQYRVLRIGPYDAVLVVQEMYGVPGGEFMPVFIFRREPSVYVGTTLIW